MPITGNFTGATVIDGVTSGASLFYFDETVGFDDAGWVVYPPNGGDNTVPIVSGVEFNNFKQYAGHVCNDYLLCNCKYACFRGLGRIC